MKAEEKYKIPIFSKTFTKPPIVNVGFTTRILLEGYDYGGEEKHKCEIIFDKVIGFKEEMSELCTFIPGSYDCVVEIEESDWIKSLAEKDEKKLRFWNPKHYALYLADYGGVQVLARGFTAKELPLD